MYLIERPDAESLPRAYENYYTHESERDDFASGNARGLLRRLINGYLNARFRMRRRPALRTGAWVFRLLPPLRMKLDVYGRHIPRALCQGPARLLDVGCGNGAFLCRALEMGIQVQGCEPDPAAAATCRNMGLHVVAGDVWTAAYADGSFTYITLNHVIEHVTDPSRLLGKLLALLEPGGTLWLALPNPSALGLRLFRRGWKGLHPPFHLLIPSQRILREWLQHAGFTDVRFVRRGMQSPGLWRESVRIAEREGTTHFRVWMATVRRVGDLLSTLTPRWGEETIVMAHRPVVQHER
ncbi:MAG: class I SAM-dependent methyltransferase [Gammaproteobacteria bacterium]|nr:class I SAM-dependent methyltransferase [Gammaproteobacteria bacterium]